MFFLKKPLLGCGDDSIGRYHPPQNQPQPVNTRPPAAPSPLREPGSPLRPRTTREEWAAGAPADPGLDRNAAKDAITLPPEQRRTALAIIDRVRAKKIEGVPLSELGLRSLPEEFGDDLSHAKTIDLSQNKLYSLTTSVAKLTKLVNLDLEANLLPKLPDEIGQMKKIRRLNLRGNLLKTLPEAIGAIHDLTYLHVDGNRLEALPAALGRLVQLRVLTASYNLLQGHLPAELRYLEQLKKLDLSHNQIWTLPPAWSDLFSRLKSAILSDNRLQALPESFKLPNRKSDLDLRNNPLVTLPGNYGGFTYKWLSGDNIRSADRHLTVSVTNTGIRQGLVNEGRLLEGDGIFREGPGLLHEDRPMPPPLFDLDVRSELSVEQFVRENQEVGGLEGLDYARQRAEDYSRAEKLAPRDAWIAEVANEYANFPGNNALELEPFPMYPELRPPRTAGAWPTLGAAAAPPGGYPAGFVGMTPGPSFAPNDAGPSNIDYQAAANVAVTDKAKVRAGMDVLRRELKALPLETRTAIVSALEAFPAELVEAKLAENLEAAKLAAALEALHVAESSTVPPRPREKPAYSTRPAQAFAQGSTRPAHLAEGSSRTAFSAVGRTSEARGSLQRGWPQERPISPPPWERIPKRDPEWALGPTDEDQYGYMYDHPQMEYGYPGIQIEEIYPAPVVQEAKWYEYLWDMGEKPYDPYREFE
ncbi:MAG: leucine-rich repeat domain-containing protein [Burkholderiales bacterium]|nr:leucine-rich repeat domain-containing protein [Burkholderiales bacterium]